MDLIVGGQETFYRFGGKKAEGSGSMQKELGGKGAALAEMTRLGVPVPPGFTIPTSVCRAFLRTGSIPEWFDAELSRALQWLEQTHGKRFGAGPNPLLVSVRSGAAVSMPGMMDTILNVGLNDISVAALAEQHEDQRFALDSYRRLLQMFGTIVLAIPRNRFDAALATRRNGNGANSDGAFTPQDLERLIADYKDVIRRNAGREFPSDPREQLNLAIRSVFESWNNERARHYRRMHDLPDDAGTAVTIQAMVFGNLGLDSGTGVGFTRNPSTGEKTLFGEFLPNAQGEDIVAGTHTPMPIALLGERMPEIYEQLTSVTSKLETHYADVQDFEFTVERKKLFLLQTRSAKRNACAAIRTAVEMADEGLITKEEALRRVPPQAINEMLSPQLDLAGIIREPIARGLAACPGSAVGQIALTADRAVHIAGWKKDNPVILVRKETTAEDIHGMDASQGFLTAHGGATSHAAVVARGLGKCCITGASGIEVDEAAGTLRIGPLVLREGDWLSLDGTTGRVFAGRLPLRQPETDDPMLAQLLSWAGERNAMSVRSNADTPDDARRARAHGASGIGLCRTEHMFFSPDRLLHVRAMILAEDKETRCRALDRLLPVQQADFEELFRAMDGLPVTIRLIDPPLHEFLPERSQAESALENARRENSAGNKDGEIKELERVLARLNQLSEKNPMMGHRGCRLGITYPEIIAMQTRAILQAAIKVEAEGFAVEPEIMVPLVAALQEIRFLRKTIEQTAREVFEAAGQIVAYKLGTMIELPRAAVCAGAIAREVDFLSFGTNDLTQMTFGFSRDDARTFLDIYLETGILEEDPFLTIDREGVGTLMDRAIRDARVSNAKIKIGVCGEHGGDPKSIDFFCALGVDYVSCSPARIPVAQLAMAQAILADTPGPTATNEEHERIVQAS